MSFRVVQEPGFRLYPRSEYSKIARQEFTTVEVGSALQLTGEYRILRYLDL